MAEQTAADPLTLPLRSRDEPAGDTAEAVLALPRRTLRLQRRAAVMGIVNRTPDSFYDRGATFGLQAALRRAGRLVDAGADIVDIGGIKGGPGEAVGVDEEIDRVVPVVERLRERHEDVLVSVDTFRAPVARAVLAAGADIVNDPTGLHDPDVLAAVADYDAGYVAMHHGGRPRTRPFRRAYHPDVTTVVIEHCRALAERAREHGIGRRQLLVDPGCDFQKTTHHSLELTRRLPELAALGYPVLVGVSNKDFIGETTGGALEDRVDASLAAALFSVLRGAHVVRVHEVARTVQALRMVESLLGRRAPTAAVRGLE